MQEILFYIFQTTLCYYDVKDGLALEPEHPEALVMMEKLQKIAVENKRMAMQMNLVGKHRDALQKISIAIETDPSVADFHVLRSVILSNISVSKYSRPLSSH